MISAGVDIRTIVEKNALYNNGTLTIVCIGIVLRLLYYFSDRSVWLDEATMAIAIIDTPWSNIFNPCYKGLPAAAPAGYVILSKIFTSTIGINELVLRFLSIVSSCVSLVLFRRYLQSNFNKTITLFALFFFAINPHLIYYSTEVKFYSIDVMATILLLITSGGYIRTKNVKSLMVFTALAIVLQWFSYITIIVSTALLASELLLTVIAARKLLPDIKLVITGVIISAHFLLFKMLFIDDIAGGSQLKTFWDSSYAPLPLHFDAFSWYFSFVKEFMAIPGGFRYVEHFSIVIFLYGFYVCLRRKPVFWIQLTAILSVSYCVSLFRMYPVYARLGLFLVSILLISIACGLDDLVKKNKSGRIVGYTSLVVLSCVPLIGVLRNACSPLRPEHIKPLVRRIAEKATPDERIYVYYGTVPAFEYYKKVYSVNNLWIEGRRQMYFDDDIKEICKRGADDPSTVWLLFAHVHSDSISDDEVLLGKLSRFGKQKEYYHEFAGATLYRYDLYPELSNRETVISETER